MPIEDVVHPFLKFYTAAPQWVKSTLGHLYALAPARLRYGAKYDEFVAEIAHCSDPAWLARRADEKLMATLRWAIDTVPAYAAYRGRQAASAEELLAAMPLLSKEAIKANPGSYLSSSMGPDTHLMSFTGGSTSVPMQLYLEKYVSRSKDFAYNTAFDQAAGIKGRDTILALPGRPVPGAGKSVTEPGVLGEMVATGFDTRVMPLIRYRTGDLAMWSAAPNRLRPGFPVVERIEGRLQEFLVCKDHRLVSICTIGAAHFEELASADRMQFEQHVPGRATLKVLSAAELTPRARAALADGIHAKTQGGLQVDIVRVDEIARSVSGKHKLLLQRLDISRYLGAAHIDSAGAE